jgi:hypothetical protein
MNEDYLWDRSGEVDPEIAELERKLGRLRFKVAAHPLVLPTALPTALSATAWYRKDFSPMMAIAATLAMLLLAGGLWLGLRASTFNAGKILQVVASGPRPPIGPIDSTTATAKPAAPQSDNSASHTVQPARFITRASAERRRELLATRASINKARVRREQQQQLAREGEAAKAQLIRALYITSDALNTVQRKIQGEQEERRPIS